MIELTQLIPLDSGSGAGMTGPGPRRGAGADDRQTEDIAGSAGRRDVRNGRPDEPPSSKRPREQARPAQGHEDRPTPRTNGEKAEPATADGKAQEAKTPATRSGEKKSFKQIVKKHLAKATEAHSPDDAPALESIQKGPDLAELLSAKSAPVTTTDASQAEGPDGPRALQPAGDEAPKGTAGLAEALAVAADPARPRGPEAGEQIDQAAAAARQPATVQGDGSAIAQSEPIPTHPSADVAPAATAPQAPQPTEAAPELATQPTIAQARPTAQGEPNAGAATERAVQGAVASPVRADAPLPAAPIEPGAEAVGPRADATAAGTPGRVPLPPEMTAQTAGPQQETAARPAGPGRQAGVPANAIARMVAEVTGDRSVQIAVSPTQSSGSASDAAAAPVPAPAPAPAVTTTAGNTARDVPSGPEPSVINQVASQFRAAGARIGQQVMIRLNPPELGRVRMTLRAEGGGVRAVLDVESPSTAAELQRQMPAMVQRMADVGVDLRRIEVNLNPNGGDSGGSGLLDQQEPGQQGLAGRQDETPGSSETEGLLANEADGPEGLSVQAAYATDESVNVWI